MNITQLPTTAIMKYEIENTKGGATERFEMTCLF